MAELAYNDAMAHQIQQQGGVEAYLLAQQLIRDYCDFLPVAMWMMGKVP